MLNILNFFLIHRIKNNTKRFITPAQSTKLDLFEKNDYNKGKECKLPPQIIGVMQNKSKEKKTSAFKLIKILVANLTMLHPPY